MPMVDHQYIELRDLRSTLILLHIMNLDGLRVKIAPT